MEGVDDRATKNKATIGPSVGKRKSSNWINFIWKGSKGEGLSGVLVNALWVIKITALTNSINFKCGGKIDERIETVATHPSNQNKESPTHLADLSINHFSLPHS